MICVFINTNQFAQQISAPIVSEINNVNKIVLIKTAIIERDFKKEFIFHTCSTVTNLATSLEFHSDLC